MKLGFSKILSPIKGFFKQFSLVSADIGIDLGTANTVVYVKRKGIVLREPSVVAIDSHHRHVLAIGTDAQKMVGRTTSSIIAIRPMKDGVIADFSITEAMIKSFLAQVCPRFCLIKPKLLIGIPYGITNVERRAIFDAAGFARTKKVYLIEEPIAAAVGAGIDIESAHGHMVVDIGGGTTEVAVISLGAIVVSESIRVAGDELNEAIQHYCRKEHNVLIGERMSEQVKISIGSAAPFPEPRYMVITGRDMVTGLPKKVELSSDDIRGVLREPISSILNAIRRTFERTPPELSADIVDSGLILTGGGALLYGLDILFQDETHIPVKIAEDPLSCVALGTGHVLERMQRWLDIYTRIHHAGR